MASPVPGWRSPVALGLIEAQCLLGVPFVLMIVLALGTILATMLVSYVMPVVGVVLYGVARVVTAVDPQWWAVFCEALDYRGYYES